MVTAKRQSLRFLYHLHTLFLFTKADIMTSLIPQVCHHSSVETFLTCHKDCLCARGGPGVQSFTHPPRSGMDLASPAQV